MVELASTVISDMKLLKSLALCISAYSDGEVFDLPRDKKEMYFAGSALLSQ